MKHILQQSRLSYLIKHRNGYLVLACGLLILCFILMLACFRLSNRERIILVPPAIERSFWVGSQNVSAEYLSEMAIFFTYLRLNVTPESADYQRQMLLRYVDPRYYGVLNDTLIAERDRIITQHLSTAFYPVNVQANAKQFSAAITGDLLSNIGTTPLPTKRVTYLIQYHYDEGRLLVSQFQEEKSHD